MTLDGAAKVGFLLFLLALVLYTGRASVRLGQTLPSREDDYTVQQHHTSDAVTLLGLFSAALAIALAVVTGVMLYRLKAGEAPSKSGAQEPAGQATTQEAAP